MYLTITRKTAERIVRERGSNLDKLKLTGRFDISCLVYLLCAGRRFTLVDLSSGEGEGIARMVEPVDRRLVPACIPDAYGTLEQRIADREEAAKLDRIRIALR